MATALIPDVKSFVEAMCGQRCWYVSVGGCTLPTFQLAFGEKVRRQRPLKNTAHSQEYREFEAEISLLVWCSWRLDSPSGPVTSSDDNEEHICEGLSRLRGAKVSTASARGPGWDLRVRFSNRLVLRIFCDHVPGDPTFSTNWELWQREQLLEVAAGSRVAFSPK
jgi:hypothetical protein